ncbi:MAG: lytic transglycosylase domain-containing protein [Neisseriaceae bacterium]|nr:lytic transglycosylase domain-containing protein [Neisseriaceae bacterium]
MKNKYLNKISLIALTALLAACTASTQRDEVVPVAETKVELPKNYHYHLPHFAHHSDRQHLIDNFYRYRNAMNAVKQGDHFQAADYLADQHSPDALKNNLRQAWLNKLGDNADWENFAQQYALLPESSRTKNINCYNELMTITQTKTISLEAAVQAKSNDNLPAACVKLITAAAYTGSLNKDEVFKRVWVSLAYNKTSEARALADALNEPLPNKLGIQTTTTTSVQKKGKKKIKTKHTSVQLPNGSRASNAAALYSIVSPDGRNKSNVSAQFNTLSGSLKADEKAFAHGILGLSSAKDLNMTAALHHFQAANPAFFSEEQWEWYARAALRLNRWDLVENIISQMPENLQNTAKWQYWQARAYENNGKQQQATPLYQAAADSGRNFYALLSQEELGIPLNAKNNAEAQIPLINNILQNKAINQALVLFEEAYQTGNREMRVAAGLQWRYAVANFDEPNLIASAQLANDIGFYEMAIYSADKTNHLLNFDLRYLSPYRETMNYYAHQNGIDPAWAYGIIRQESRFMMTAQSGVGASGLMQIMPATARLIAKQIGISDYDINDLNTNIQMGTWYLADGRNKLGSEVLATAGYNAGPHRARKWQANVPLEGAIYAETIPFNETRDYVKKVMTNTMYYNALFGNSGSLKQRMGTVAARD